MSVQLSILFYSKTSKTLRNGSVPIYIRVTINGERFEQSTNRQIQPGKWSKASGKALGNSEESKSLNYYLDTLRNKVFKYQQEIVADGNEVTIHTIREKWLVPKEKPRLLLDIFKEHNRQMKVLIGKEYAPLTYVRFETSFRHTQNFIKWKYKQDDIDIKKLDFYFINEFAFWLKSVRNCNQNSTIKYLSNFKKIVNFCIKNGWIIRNPFVGFKMIKKDVVREILTLEEMQTMSAKVFVSERVNQVRDIFLLCCYTGLAYADVKKLKRSEIVKGIDGERWIFTSRQKTETPSRIPILAPALELIDKYSDHPDCISKNILLPVLSNQKMNAYLKEIADVCGIEKELTFHIARHTFATTITLSNGVPIETVSKMLGHKSLRTTQIYAKVLDLKVSEDMQRLRSKFLTGSKPNLQ
jgi:site-specific recombinase XerD